MKSLFCRSTEVWCYFWVHQTAQLLTEPDFRVGMFLDRATVERLARQVVLHPMASSPAGIALFFSLLAVGSHYLNLRQGSRHGVSGVTRLPVMKLFRKALDMRPQARDDATLLSLQVGLTPLPDHKLSKLTCNFDALNCRLCLWRYVQSPVPVPCVLTRKIQM